MYKHAHTHTHLCMCARKHALWCWIAFQPTVICSHGCQGAWEGGADGSHAHGAGVGVVQLCKAACMAVRGQVPYLHGA